MVQFIVDVAGNISDVKALTAHGYGMEEEAVRIIRSGPKWTPCIQNGKQVKAYKRQPVTFIVGKGEKNFPSAVKPTGHELNEIVVTDYSQQNKDNIVFDKPETPPSFPGGVSGWKKYLERNANSLIPVEKGAPEGVYRAVVRFIVKADGMLSDIKAITNFGYGMEEEAERLISKGPKWAPARQNGHDVNAYVQQPVTFEISGEDGSDETLKGIALPLENAVLKTPFGKYKLDTLIGDNPGITLVAPKGSKVRSMQNGVIAGVFNMGSYYAITITEDNYFTTYSGLENSKLIKGQKVNKGDIIGVVSANGNYELEFIVMKGTKNIDPVAWLKIQ